MPSDADILDNARAALAYEPMLNSDAIAVEVRDGVVTLGGIVEGYGDKSRAGRA
jgi:osmotically-inducible protein OsmY